MYLQFFLSDNPSFSKWLLSSSLRTTLPPPSPHLATPRNTSTLPKILSPHLRCFQSQIRQNNKNLVSGGNGEARSRESLTGTRCSFSPKSLQGDKVSIEGKVDTCFTFSVPSLMKASCFQSSMMLSGIASTGNSPPEDARLACADPLLVDPAHRGIFPIVLSIGR